MTARAAAAGLLMWALAPTAAVGFQLDIRPAPLAWEFDAESRTAVPLLGLPGAAMWGEPALLSSEAVQAAFRRGRALVATTGGSVLTAPALTAAEPAWRELRPAFEADRVWLNATGTRGLTADSRRALAQFVSGIDAGAPVLSAVVALPAAWQTVAVARAANCALVAGREESNGYVARVCAGQATVRLFEAEGLDPAAVAWMPGERQAVVADRAGHRVLLISAVTRGAAVETLASEADGLRAPVLIDASAEGDVIAVNGADTERTAALVRIPAVRGNAPRLIALPGQPETLEMLPSGFVFATAKRQESGFLLDLQEEQAYVVPVR